MAETLAGRVGRHLATFTIHIKFRFPLITISLVNRCISYSHTLLLRSLPFQ